MSGVELRQRAGRWEVLIVTGERIAVVGTHMSRAAARAQLVEIAGLLGCELPD